MREHPDDGLIFNWDADGNNMRTFARIDVSGLTREQIEELRAKAREMQPAEGNSHA